ncbi:MAG: hypothetical protein FJ290_10895 [Planctomycetes bacterium]|nr:hypothetical protein [Planctomycetota bacterium]
MVVPALRHIRGLNLAPMRAARGRKIGVQPNDVQLRLPSQLLHEPPIAQAQRKAVAFGRFAGPPGA